MFSALEKEFPDFAAETLAIQHRELPKGWDADIPSFPADAKGIASRDSSGKVLNAIAKHHPWLLAARRISLRLPRHVSHSKVPAKSVGFARRKKLALRSAGARDGVHPQRPGADQA